MRQSILLLKTKKNVAEDVNTASHRWLLRGDFISQLSAGIYTLMPLGWRVHQKISKIIREEMDVLGAQEIFMPSLHPKSIWQEAGRWNNFDPPLFKLKDRHKREYALGSTHEEVVTDLIRHRLSSYKELPFSVYQIQTKFRNEMRATGGLLRTREFVMKDLYSFHKDEEGLMNFYEEVKKSYVKIFGRVGIKVVPVEAETGSIGGSESHEYMLIADAGEDRVAICEGCGFSVGEERLKETKKSKRGGGLGCLSCNGSLIVKNCIESGHTFKLGTKYSEAMGAYYADEGGNKRPVVMGCYGIGVGRLLAAIAEASHDGKGIIWPEAVAPFKYHLLVLNSQNKGVKNRAEEIYKKLIGGGEEVLFDDREDVSPGEKFTDADILGIPYRLVISEKTGEKVEIKKRSQGNVKKVGISHIVGK